MEQKPVCVVAGVGPGIGLAVAKRFAREGFHIALLARRGAALRGFAAEMAADGDAAHAFEVDLAQPSMIHRAFQTIEETLGSPSVLIYNAAAWHEGDPMQLDPDLFTADLSLCATGALVCAQAVYPQMKRRAQGSILLTGGGLALNPEYGAHLVSLTAGKAAMRGVALALAAHLEPMGIHVATVTVTGRVGPQTAFDPDRIADEYWYLHTQTRGNWTREIIFKGR
jgi:NAD(P)-dependent dehydrogenase (short-subunit alcohol dehydrogenase family)